MLYSYLKILSNRAENNYMSMEDMDNKCLRLAIFQLHRNIKNHLMQMSLGLVYNKQTGYGCYYHCQ